MENPGSRPMTFYVMHSERTFDVTIELPNPVTLEGLRNAIREKILKRLPAQSFDVSHIDTGRLYEDSDDFQNVSKVLVSFPIMPNVDMLRLLLDFLSDDGVQAAMTVSLQARRAAAGLSGKNGALSRLQKITLCRFTVDEVLSYGLPKSQEAAARAFKEQISGQFIVDLLKGGTIVCVVILFMTIFLPHRK
jgi:hypothetical protein